MNLSARHAVEIIRTGNRTLVFAHGYGCDKNMWRRLIPHFENNFRIVLYDLMGCGASEVSHYDQEKYATLQGHATDLINILDDYEVTSAILVGHSVSAMTVALVANQRPELVDSLVMVCPSPSFVNDAEYEGGFERADIDALLETLDANYLGWSSQMAPAIMGTPHMPEMGEELRESFCQTDPDVARHFAQVTFLADHRDDIQKLKQETLVLQCKEDVIVPPSVGDWMIAHMPNAELTELDAMGHCPHISYPDQTARAVQNFLGVHL